MKTRLLILFIPVISFLSSCMWGTPHNPKPAITKDTLTYSYQTIKQRANDCGNKPDSACTVALIKYPVFANQSILNDSVRHKLLNIFKLNSSDTGLQAMATDFIGSYDKYKNADNRNQFYTLNLKANIIRQDSSLLTMEFDGRSFEGGAHDSYRTIFFNWNTKANKKILLTDILVSGYENKLTQVADSIFRKEEKLSPTESLSNNYFFKDNKFALNNNYSITPLGIRFLYNEYEIKPFAAGQTDLFIPYAKIKLLLRPNTILSQYIK